MTRLLIISTVLVYSSQLPAQLLGEGLLSPVIPVDLCALHIAQVFVKFLINRTSLAVTTGLLIASKHGVRTEA